MIWAAVIAGLSLGVVGSLHCVGMCGPLSLALPVHHMTRARQLLALFVYQLGRIITYSAFGLVFGLAGSHVYLAGFQQWFSVVMGIVVLLLVTLYWVYNNPLQPSVFKRLYGRLLTYMMKAFRSRKSLGGFVVMGMANGLLPCGMVYVAIAASLTTSDAFYSVAFMAMFGAGTLPAMIAVGYFGRLVSLPVRNMFRKSVPVFMTLMAVILILRGLNLGIPFISPVLQSAPGSTVNCHP